jgi:predicted HTH transcriptional regulator
MASSLPPSPVGYERSPVQGSDLEDLDQDGLHAYLQARAPELLESRAPEQLATSFGLLASAGGRTVPTVAGLILFGTYPQIGRPEWGVAVARIKGTRISDPVAARRDLEGNLPLLLEAISSFVAEQTQSIANLVDPAQSEPEYPEAAVREAALNALIHRDYRLTGRAAVRIFDDRLEVWNPGGMPVQLSLEHLAQHGGVSFPRNPVLAAAARSLGLIDQIGRGLPTIRRSISEVTSLSAHFGSSQSDFLVVLPSRLTARPGDTGGN